jgi:Uma2 family endonuclease
VIYPPRKRWTRAECESMEATGLWDRDRLELVHGELITKLPKKRPHVVVFIAVLGWLADVFGMDYLNPAGPIDVAPEDNPTSEPEPDIAVLAKAGPEYMGGNPPASDVRLVIEVSDSTIAFDLGPKARLYARAGIPEYWVFDIGSRRLIIHRDPREARYSTVTAYAEGETVTPLFLPTASFPVATAFPFFRRPGSCGRSVGKISYGDPEKDVAHGPVSATKRQASRESRRGTRERESALRAVSGGCNPGGRQEARLDP